MLGISNKAQTVGWVISFPKIKENFFFWVAFVGILQAVTGNVLSVNIPMLTVVMICYLLYKFTANSASQNGPLTYNYSFVVLVLVSLILLVFAWGIDATNARELFFHLNVIICIMFAKTFCKNIAIKLSLFSKLLWIYIIASLVIYLFFWDFFANMISQEEDLINLKSSGVMRSFGLLFNPLSNAYFLLLTFYLLMAINEKGYILLKGMIIISIILCFTRGALISLALFGILYLLYRRKWIMIGLVVFAIILAYIFIEPFQVIVNSILTFEDSQGSAQGHVESVSKAIASFLDHPEGTGFGKLAVESWVFNYGLTYGVAGFLILLIPWSFIMLKLFFYKRYLNFIVLFSFLPVTFIIPFHTFNLPILVFYLIIYTLYNNTNTISYEDRN